MHYSSIYLRFDDGEDSVMIHQFIFSAGQLGFGL